MKTINFFKYRKIIFSMILAVFAFNLGLNATPPKRKNLPFPKRGGNSLFLSLIQAASNAGNDNQAQQQLTPATQPVAQSINAQKEIIQQVTSILNPLFQSIVLLLTNQLQPNTINRKHAIPIANNITSIIQKNFCDPKLISQFLRTGELNLQRKIPITNIETINHEIFNLIFYNIIIGIYLKKRTVKLLDLRNNLLDYLQHNPTFLGILGQLEGFEICKLTEDLTVIFANKSKTTNPTNAKRLT